MVTYYDIPTISLRDVLLPRLTDDPDEEMPRWFRTGETVVEGDSKVIAWGGVPVDMMHVSGLGIRDSPWLILSSYRLWVTLWPRVSLFGILPNKYISARKAILADSQRAVYAIRSSSTYQTSLLYVPL